MRLSGVFLFEKNNEVCNAGSHVDDHSDATFHNIINFIKKKERKCATPVKREYSGMYKQCLNVY